MNKAQLDTKADTIHTHVHTDITDFDAGVQTNRLDQLAVPTANIDVNSQKLVNLQDGALNSDAVNKGQLDTGLAGKADTVHTHIHTDITDFDAGVQTNRLDQLAAPT